MTSRDLPALNAAVDKLMTLLALRQEELRDYRLNREQIFGTDAREEAIRAEIENLKMRLERAEHLQDEALGN
jgi:hypothetical protein